jgi:hypothetical protein
MCVANAAFYAIHDCRRPCSRGSLTVAFMVVDGSRLPYGPFPPSPLSAASEQMMVSAVLKPHSNEDACYKGSGYIEA